MQRHAFAWVGISGYSRSGKKALSRCCSEIANKLRREPNLADVTCRSFCKETYRVVSNSSSAKLSLKNETGTEYMYVTTAIVPVRNSDDVWYSGSAIGRTLDTCVGTVAKPC